MNSGRQEQKESDLQSAIDAVWEELVKAVHKGGADKETRERVIALMKQDKIQMGKHTNEEIAEWFIQRIKEINANQSYTRKKKNSRLEKRMIRLKSCKFASRGYNSTNST